MEKTAIVKRAETTENEESFIAHILKKFIEYITEEVQEFNIKNFLYEIKKDLEKKRPVHLENYSPFHMIRIKIAAEFAADCAANLLQF